MLLRFNHRIVIVHGKQTVQNYSISTVHWGKRRGLKAMPTYLPTYLEAPVHGFECHQLPPTYLPTYLPVFLWLPTNVKTEPTIGKNKFFKKKKTKKIKFRHLYSGRSLSLSEMNNCEFLNAWTIFILFTLLMNYLLFNYSRDWTMWL